jgi:hypothetical protein
MILDGGLGEMAISGCCDVALNGYGRWVLPGPEPKFWIPIGCLIVFQAVMIAALIRLRPEPRAAYILQDDESA